MPTLYVENVPEELYDALRNRAKANRRSIAAEVLELLADNVPTLAEIKRRKRIVQQIRAVQERESPVGDPFPSAEEMLREDRAR
jgi:plasmid stability protein